MRSVPVALRLLVCVGITAGCWLLFVLLMMAMVGTVAKRR
jgi:hypothetical protein